MPSFRTAKLGAAAALILPLATGCGIIDQINKTIAELSRTLEQAAEAASREMSGANQAIGQAISSAQTSINFATQGGAFSPSQGGFGNDRENAKSGVFRSQFKAARMTKFYALQDAVDQGDYCTGETITEGPFDCPNGGSQSWSFTCTRADGMETYVYSSQADNCTYSYSDDPAAGYCGDAFCDNNGDIGEVENIDSCPADCAAVNNAYCNDGTEIPAGWVGDGYCDCRDGEDEAPGTCDGAPPQFCADGTPVEGWQFNDGYCNCPDGSDEAPGYCDGGAGGDSFMCQNGQSIPLDRQNDGYCDCSDGSDEAPGSCGGPPVGAVVNSITPASVVPDGYVTVNGTMLAPPPSEACPVDGDYVLWQNQWSGDYRFFHRSTATGFWSDGGLNDAYVDFWANDVIGMYAPAGDGPWEVWVYLCWTGIGNGIVTVDSAGSGKVSFTPAQGGGSTYTYTVNGTMDSEVSYPSGGEGFSFNNFTFRSTMTEKAEMDGQIQYLNETENFEIVSIDNGDGTYGMSMNGRMAYQDTAVDFDFTYENFVFTLLGGDLASGMTLNGAVTMTGGKVGEAACVENTRFDFVTIDPVVANANHPGCNDSGTLEITVNAGTPDEAVGTYRFSSGIVSITSADATVEPNADNTIEKSCDELAAEAAEKCGALGGGATGGDNGTATADGEVK